jgi:hypothetical protein
MSPIQIINLIKILLPDLKYVDSVVEETEFELQAEQPETNKPVMFGGFYDNADQYYLGVCVFKGANPEWLYYFPSSMSRKDVERLVKAYMGAYH